MYCSFTVFWPLGIHFFSLDLLLDEASHDSLELIVWLVPSLIGDAVAVALVGVLLGPFYPIAMNHAGRVLPRWLLTVSIGWIAGFGQVFLASRW